MQPQDLEQIPEKEDHESLATIPEELIYQACSGCEIQPRNKQKPHP